VNLKISKNQVLKLDTEDFLTNYRNKLFELFHERNEENRLVNQRGLPPYVLRKVLECNPLSAFIPSEHGGRGGRTAEALSMLETTSYQSLPLCLMMGINGALFLQPLANYGNEEAQNTVFTKFLKEKNMGGLMITEPDYGSDALRMQTGFKKSENGNSPPGLITG